MCTVCGCGMSVVEDKDKAQKRDAHGHDHDHGRHHRHGHHHHHGHDHDHQPDHEHHDHDHHHQHGVESHGDDSIHYGAGLAGVHAPGLSQERIIKIERDILSKNDAYARENRHRLVANGNFALNFVSSPGSGKTSLLVRAIEDLKARREIVVIEGDQQTSNDAERIRATGARALQINTGKGCHLDAHMVGHAIDTLAPEKNALLFIENVGNLVCPSAFDLGEAHKVVVLSVTEGEDKPLKYPDMFAAADLMLLNKADLLPHLDFDVGACMAAALTVNPDLQTLVVSARSGEGMQAFYAWIEARAARMAIAE
ncbi:hydrogenase nickel incorporation protein HypB [Methylocystis suflitae]|uniref:hydrogenase nickel incorporation protein HypB n=1 Tax=Methylocystis suflitae TaxID=2951405 RepID=UPI00210E6AD1|nr:hydrogenase nickel incorporation protein HypB [Methylocystis suflitae]MCQ4188621.1 hydrogenase nickel incorporation protein HypB [Methylocystis suflitae]